MKIEVGQRKLIATLSYAILAFGLGFAALILDKVSGGEFVSISQAVGVVVAGFIGLNVAGKIFGKDGGS